MALRRVRTRAARTARSGADGTGWLEIDELVDVVRSLRASLDDGLDAAAGALAMDRPDIARALVVEQCKATRRWHPDSLARAPGSARDQVAG